MKAPLLVLLLLALSRIASAQPTVERWGLFEAGFTGPSTGNPFTDVALKATFTQGNASHDVTGFYDGGGKYFVRFMPETIGEWRFVTHSNRPELDGRSGTFTAVAPSAANHGPVSVAHTFHFAYADGTPFRQVGTTCYAWIHQGDAREEQTLKTLASSPFNKLRMCIFPKFYEWNKNDPAYFPFEGTANHWDTTRFNPEFFHHLEKRLAQLRDLGIEADLILFHPYDKGHWGFDRMDAASDDRYLRYVVARLAAFRHVWWSMANEYDFMKEKTEADWDRFFHIVQSSDPYAHLRSIHNGSKIYNHTQPWVTHVSIQDGAAVGDPERAMLLRDVYRKPIVYDEVKYEGDIPQRWGQLSADEMVFRFWNGLIGGTYVGHGETYANADEILWWSKGGVLKGQSPARLAFLRKVMDESPAEGIDPIDKWQDENTAGKAGEYYLIYFGKSTPKEWPFTLYKDALKDGQKFQVEILDTWAMTVTPVGSTFTTKKRDNYFFEDAAKKSVALPGKPYLALRIRRVP